MHSKEKLDPRVGLKSLSSSCESFASLHPLRLDSMPMATHLLEMLSVERQKINTWIINMLKVD